MVVGSATAGSVWQTYAEHKANTRQTGGFDSAFAEHVKGGKHAPYEHLAKDGVIDYKGVQFFCDAEKNRISLGDISNPRKCMRVALEGGGTLMVNYDNLGDLSKAITMFSPEDQRRIMYAITVHKIAVQAEAEIDEDTSGIGESAEAAMDGEPEERMEEEDP